MNSRHQLWLILMLQQLGLRAFTAGAWVRFLVRELRSHKPSHAAKPVTEKERLEGLDVAAPAVGRPEGSWFWEALRLDCPASTRQPRPLLGPWAAGHLPRGCGCFSAKTDSTHSLFITATLLPPIPHGIRACCPPGWPTSSVLPDLNSCFCHRRSR